MPRVDIIDEIKCDSRKMYGELVNSSCSSDWLKEAFKTASQRDIVDALNDAEMLVIYLNKKLNEEFYTNDRQNTSHRIDY